MIEEMGWGDSPLRRIPFLPPKESPPRAIVLARWSFKGGKSQHSDEWGGRKEEEEQGTAVTRKKKEEEGGGFDDMAEKLKMLPSPFSYSLSLRTWIT